MELLEKLQYSSGFLGVLRERIRVARKIAKSRAKIRTTPPFSAALHPLPPPQHTATTHHPKSHHPSHFPSRFRFQILHPTPLLRPKPRPAEAELTFSAARSITVYAGTWDLLILPDLDVFTPHVRSRGQSMQPSSQRTGYG